MIVTVPADSVLSALTASVLDAARAIGLDAEALREAAGVDADVLADPDLRVPLERHFKLWQLLAEEPRGLELGAQIGIAGLGVIGYAMQHGATAGAALEWLWRHRALVHPDVIHPIEKRGDEVVFAGPVPAPFVALREPVYTQATATVALIEALTGAKTAPRFVALPVARASDAARVEAFLACPVAWASPLLEVGFDASVLARPLPRSDERLFGYLARRVAKLHDELPAETSFAARARREIGARLAHGEPRLADVAQRLAVSERTLHRRLKEEDASFAMLVEESRRERALLLLEDAGLSASEIAFLLGYAEPAAFFRAFKRWTQATPQEWRRSRG